MDPVSDVLAAIGLGSNLGDRRAHLRDAVAGLGHIGRVERVSSLYETEPIGGPAQGPFLNAVALLETAHEPRAVLGRLLDLERRSGRERRERWGPRTLDLDLLLYGDQRIDEPGLRVPHPRMTERRFVLEPLLEVWPDAVLPGGAALASFVDGVGDQQVAVIAGPDWP